MLIIQLPNSIGVKKIPQNDRVVQWEPHITANLLATNRPVLWTWKRLINVTAPTWERPRKCT